MDLNPITINGVVQANEVVEFNTYDDQSFTNGTFLERVTTDSNGVATLTQTVPAGKLLYASIEVTDGGITYSKGRFFTDFTAPPPSSGETNLEEVFEPSDLLIESTFELDSLSPAEIQTQLSSDNDIESFQLLTTNGGTYSVITDPTDGQNNVLEKKLQGNSGTPTTRSQFDMGIDNNVSRPFVETLGSARMYIPNDIESLIGFSGSYFIMLGEIWMNNPGATDSSRISLYLGSLGSENQPYQNTSDYLYWRVKAEQRDPQSFIWEYENKNITVPIGQWFKFEMYYKFGDVNNGRFIIDITVDGQAAQRVFNITNDTTNPLSSVNGYKKFQFPKLYASSEVANYIVGQNNELKIYYDDLKYFIKRG